MKPLGFDKPSAVVPGPQCRDRGPQIQHKIVLQESVREENIVGHNLESYVMPHPRFHGDVLLEASVYGFVRHKPSSLSTRRGNVHIIIASV